MSIILVSPIFLSLRSPSTDSIQLSLPWRRLYDEKTFFLLASAQTLGEKAFSTPFLFSLVFSNQADCVFAFCCARRKRSAKNMRKVPMKSGFDDYANVGARLIRRRWSKGSPLWWGQRCHRRFEINNERGFFLRCATRRDLVPPAIIAGRQRPLQTAREAENLFGFHVRSPWWKGENEVLRRF